MNNQDNVDNKVVTLTATAHGYVQGVGYRVFIRSAAWQLGVRGYARNMPDGTVQVIASGARHLLDRLLKEIRRGPAGAHIMSVDTEWREGETDRLAPRFEVRH